MSLLHGEPERWGKQMFVFYKVNIVFIIKYIISHWIFKTDRRVKIVIPIILPDHARTRLGEQSADAV